MPAATVSGRALSRLGLDLVALGADHAWVHEHVGFALDEPPEPTVRFPAEQYAKLLSKAAERLADPDLPLRVAQRRDVSTYEALGFAFASSATYQDAVRRLVRFERYWGCACVLDVRFTSGGATLTAVPIARSDGGAYEVAAQLAVAVVCRVSQQVLGGSWRSRVATTAGPARNRNLERTVLGPEVEHLAPMDGLSIEADVLDLPMEHAWPKLVQYLDVRLDAEISQHEAPDPVRVRVRGLLYRRLSDGVPELSSVARELAMSERALQRALADEGTTYQDIVDTCRFELARAALHGGGLPISDVAYLVGFTDPSSFYRAFKRWTGTTPAAWRESV